MAEHMKSARPIVVIVWLALLTGCVSTGTPRLQNVLAQQQRAEQAYTANNLAQALAGYQALTRALPLNADYWFRLGNVHVRMDQPDEAIAAYQHALQREPGHAKAWHNLGIVRLRQAAAAFTRSAQTATGIDPVLQNESTQMAHGIALLNAPSENTPEATTGSAAPTASIAGTAVSPGEKP